MVAGLGFVVGCLAGLLFWAWRVVELISFWVLSVCVLLSGCLCWDFGSVSSLWLRVVIVLRTLCPVVWHYPLLLDIELFGGWLNGEKLCQLTYHDIPFEVNPHVVLADDEQEAKS